LFSEWLLAAQEVEASPADGDDDPAFYAASDRQWNIGQAILGTPADGMVGVAVRSL
jgi:hypothetical protein